MGKVKRALAGSFDSTPCGGRDAVQTSATRNSYQSQTTRNFRPGKAPKTAGGLGLHSQMANKITIGGRTGDDFMKQFARKNPHAGFVEDDSFSGNSIAWKTNNLMKKAKKTLADINEHA